MTEKDKASIMLRVSKDLDDQITAEAKQLSISKNGYIVLLLQGRLNRPATNQAPNPAA
jgi:predicted HicB family RNase H-like nuclease